MMMSADSLRQKWPLPWVQSFLWGPLHPIKGCWCCIWTSCLNSTIPSCPINIKDGSVDDRGRVQWWRGGSGTFLFFFPFTFLPYHIKVELLRKFPWLGMGRRAGSAILGIFHNRSSLSFLWLMYSLWNRVGAMRPAPAHKGKRRTLELHLMFS